MRLCGNPYSAEGPALHRMHHKPYIGEPNRTAPEKLKTVLRQPVREI